MPPYHKSGQIVSIRFDRNVKAYFRGHIYISDGPMKLIERPILTAAMPRIQQSAIKTTGGKSERRQPPSARRASRSTRDIEMSSPPPASPPTESRELLPRLAKVIKPPPKPEGDVSHSFHKYYNSLLLISSTATRAWTVEIC